LFVFNFSEPEIDISVSKLLGFETFAKFLRVSVSVSENFVSGKKYRFRFQKNLVSEKSLGFGFGKLVSEKRFRFRKIWSRKKVSVLVSENLVSEKGFGFGKFGL